MVYYGPRELKVYDYENDDKTCRRCKKQKKLKYFYLTTAKNLKYSEARRYPQNICKACTLESIHLWEQLNPERAERSCRNRRLKRMFGITASEYERILKAQDNCCALCQGQEPDRRFNFLCVDHDHKTKKVRGLLCSNCNRGLGQFKDSSQLLRKAIKYLGKSGRTTNQS